MEHSFYSRLTEFDRKLIEKINAKTEAESPAITDEEVKNNGYGFYTIKRCIFTDAYGVQRLDSYYNQSIGALLLSGDSADRLNGQQFNELREKLSYFVKNCTKCNLPEDKIQELVNKILSVLLKRLCFYIK